MNNKLSPLQVILFVVLIFAIILAVGIFAFKKNNQNSTAAPVSMWGIVDEKIMTSLQNRLNEDNEETINIVYTQKSPDTFEAEMVEALASGNAPDIFLLPNELLLKQRNKLFKIDYKTYPQRDFKNDFIEGSEILLNKDGILGVPLIVDPLVLYWNRAKLNSAGVSQSPEYWDEFMSLVPKLVVRDSNLNIQDSAVALGEFQNIKNAKEIFLTLLMQAGNPGIVLTTTANNTEEYASTFDDRSGFSVRPADASLNFYAQFSNPTKDVYTWNKSLPNSTEMFLSNDLAFYLGFASEYKEILLKNPNLNFDIAVVPQSKASESKKTIANFQILTLSKNTPNLANAYVAIKTLTNKETQQILSGLTDLPPVRRDLLAERQGDSVKDIFYRSAIISKAFLDPSPKEMTRILSDMIESFTSGRSKLTEAVDRAAQQISRLIIN